VSATEHFFDAKQLIVLGRTLTSAQRTGFDLMAIHRHSQVRDR
jgi:hypothetical protein